MDERVNDEEIFVGRFVRLLSIPDDGFDYPPSEEAFRQSAIGRVCRIVEPYGGTSKGKLRLNQATSACITPLYQPMDFKDILFT